MILYRVEADDWYSEYGFQRSRHSEENLILSAIDELPPCIAHYDCSSMRWHFKCPTCGIQKVSDMHKDRTLSHLLTHVKKYPTCPSCITSKLMMRSLSSTKKENYELTKEDALKLLLEGREQISKEYLLRHL